MDSEAVVFVADAGSAAKGNFHWVCSDSVCEPSSSTRELPELIVGYLDQGRKVALGYECPLFVPIPEQHSHLGKARCGECTPATGNRPFNAGAGAAIFATGIQSLCWVLNEVKNQRISTQATTSWTQFRTGEAELLIWEAFVSGSEKASPPSHTGDAKLAIDAFLALQHEECPASAITNQDVFSIAGAAILHADLSKDLELLREPCLVLRPIPKAPFAEYAKLEQSINANQEGLGHGG